MGGGGGPALHTLPATRLLTEAVPFLSRQVFPILAVVWYLNSTYLVFSEY